jgi:hypothetical protein
MTSAPLVFLRTWLLPLALGAAAVGLHYTLHVPPGPLPPPSPAEVEAEKKAAEKKKREEEIRQRAEDRKAGKPVKPRNTVRELVYEPFRHQRTAHILEQLWAYYEPTSFKKEPIFEAWQNAHKPLLWQIVDATRNTAQPGSPAIEVAHSECRTIRCQLTITAPTKEVLVTEIAALEQLHLGAGPLWHRFDADTPIADTNKAGAAIDPPRFKATLTVSFTRDLPTLPEISLPGKGPLIIPSPPSAGPIPATGQPIIGAGTAQPATAKSPTKTSKTTKPTKPADPSPG